MILHGHFKCMQLAFMFYVLVYLQENILLHIILWGTYCTVFTIVVVAVSAIVYSFLLLPIFVAISQHEANIRLMTK